MTTEARSNIGLVLVSSALVLAALPLFMVGGLAVQMRADLGLSPASLGAALTTGFVVGAVSAPFGGRIADRLGARSALLLGASLSGMALFGLGVFTNSWVRLVAFLAVAGLAVAITDPGLAILVNTTIERERHGLAFGLKEASIPAATLAAGVAVPAIALTVGWRWAFATGVVPLAVVMTLLFRVSATNETRATGPRTAAPQLPTSAPRGAIFLTAVAAALGTAAASGVGVFLTESAVAMGIGPGAAGLLLATGSVAGIITRISSGLLADRSGRGDHFQIIAAMLAVGGLAMALGGTGHNVLLVIGTIGAFAGAWGWTGLYFLSLVKASPTNPGAVSGIGVAGLGAGNAAGPILFGLAAQTLSFRAAWIGAGMVAGLGALLMVWARKKMIAPV